MQAIILAAGMGKRLKEYTKENTKCMVPVNGVPMIDRLLDQLSGLNLRRIVMVVGYCKDNLISHIREKYGERLNVEFIENPVYNKTNNIYSLALAKERLASDDTILLESDLMLDDEILPSLVANPCPNIALVAKYRSWMDGTMVKIDDECNIVNFIPKKAFKYSEKDSYYKTVNVYKFSREFSCHKYIPFLEAYCEALGNNEYYEQVLRVICMLNNSDLKALPVDGAKWYESDDKADLDVASSLFAFGEERLRKYQQRYGGYWRFPGLLDYCYLVNPYFPSAKMKDELRSNFDVLLTEYPSGMKVNSLLASKCFGVSEDFIVPGNGAAELIKALMERTSGRMGVIYPTFEEYPNRKPGDSIVKFVPDKDDFSYGADELIAFFSNNSIEQLLLVNPDNPSGNMLPKDEVFKLAGWCADSGIRLVVDESFVDFASDDDCFTLLDDDILRRYPAMTVVKSISKSYGVPGLRLGILASADTNLVREVKENLSIWNINSFAEFFMQIFNKYEADYREARSRFVRERARFKAELDTIPFLDVRESSANFFLCRVKEPMDSHTLTEQLLNGYEILVKDCSAKKGFDGRSYIRVAIRSEEDNRMLVKALRQFDE